MRNRLLAVGVALCAAAPAIAAQQSATPPAPRLGIGVDQSSTIYLPIRLNDHLRLEPDVALWRARSEAHTQYNGQTGIEHYEGKESFSEIGVGLLFEQTHGERFRSYVGPRAGVLLNRSRGHYDFQQVGEDETATAKRTDVFGALSAGGEYFLARHFSVGAEARVTYVHQGDEKTTFDGTQTYQTAGIGGVATFSTGGEFILRIYR